MAVDRRSVITGSLAAGLAAAVGSQAASAQSLPNGTPIRCIALEEHCLPPAVYEVWGAVGGGGVQKTWRGGGIKERPRGPEFTQDTLGRLRDFEGQRLEDMDRAGIEMALLSLVVDGPQGQPDPKAAKDMMVRGNDAMAEQVSKHPDRFAAFGCLSMHGGDETNREFERMINTLGFRGVLLNNWQKVGDGDAILTYDDPRFDEFWATAAKLEAREGTSGIEEKAGRPKG